MSFVILAHVKSLEELTDPWPDEVKLAGQEVIIDIDLEIFVSSDGINSIWVKTFEGKVYWVVKQNLHKFEIIDWGIDFDICTDYSSSRPAN